MYIRDKRLIKWYCVLFWNFPLTHGKPRFLTFLAVAAAVVHLRFNFEESRKLRACARECPLTIEEDNPFVFKRSRN